MPSPTTYIELMRSYLDGAASDRTAAVLAAIPRVLLNWGEPASASVCVRNVLLSACTVAAPACIRDSLLCPEGIDECLARVRTLFPSFPDSPTAFFDKRRGADTGDWCAALNQHWAICSEMDACLADRKTVVATLRAATLCMLHDTHGFNEIADSDRLTRCLDELIDESNHTVSYLADLDIAQLALTIWNKGVLKLS